MRKQVLFKVKRTLKKRGFNNKEIKNHLYSLYFKLLYKKLLIKIRKKKAKQNIAKEFFQKYRSKLKRRIKRKMRKALLKLVRKLIRIGIRKRLRKKFRRRLIKALFRILKRKLAKKFRKLVRKLLVRKLKKVIKKEKVNNNEMKLFKQTMLTHTQLRQKIERKIRKVKVRTKIKIKMKRQLKKKRKEKVKIALISIMRKKMNRVEAFHSQLFMLFRKLHFLNFSKKKQKWKQNIRNVLLRILQNNQTKDENQVLVNLLYILSRVSAAPRKG